jgi:hypothetical protein
MGQKSENHTKPKSANKEKSKKRDSLQSSIDNLHGQLVLAKSEGDTRQAEILQKIIDRFERMKK